jgi:hypothetical protein
MFCAPAAPYTLLSGHYDKIQQKGSAELDGSENGSKGK